MPHIDYHFSTISPFAYLAGDRLERIAERHGATVAYRPVDLGRIFAATGGKAPPDRSIQRQEYRMQELRRQSAKAGLPLNPQPAHFPTNPAPAAYAIIAADKAGGGDVGALVRAVLAACWADQKNIAEDEVIRACLTAAGFDPGLADSGLLSGAMAYERYTEEAMAAGVFGSPFYIVDGTERFFGQDRLDDLDLYLSGKL